MCKNFLIAICFFLMCTTCYSQQENQLSLISIKGLQVKWKFDQSRDKKKSLSTFIVCHPQLNQFLQGDWALYFNTMKEIDYSSVTTGFSITHINGDFYKIAPKSIGGSLYYGDSLSISFLFTSQVVNRTDIPSGLFFVMNNQAYPVKDYLIATDESGFRKTIPAFKIYQDNASIDAASNQAIKIIPTPVSLQAQSGSFILNSNTTIVSDEAFKKEAAYLSGELKELLLNTVTKVPAPESHTILLKKITGEATGYQLTVNGNGITIAAADRDGIFYGIQSLKLLLDPGSWSAKKASIAVPLVSVKDKPRFAYRGLMVDIARNFQPLPQLLKIIDLMALYKMNVLHFHFSDDEAWRLQIPGLPELTDIGGKRGWPADDKDNLIPAFGSGPAPDFGPDNGYYTRSQFIQLLKYAAERHITVIPEVETPGHARAAIKAMDVRYERYIKTGNKIEAEKYLLRDLNDSSTYYSAQMFNDNVLCVAQPSVYTFLEKITDELKSMYTDAGAVLSTVHFGGDELPAGAWTKSPLCMQLIAANPKLKATGDLWYYYISKVNTLLKRRGLTFSGWEEAALRKTTVNGQTESLPNPDFKKEDFKVYVWNNVIGFGAEDLPYQLANAGYKIVMSCTSNFYFDLANDTSYQEPGHYWGGYIDAKKVYSFIPYNYYLNAYADYQFHPVAHSFFDDKEQLQDKSRANIIGLNATLFSEKVKTGERMEYMLLPKLVVFAEKAWSAEKHWETITDSVQREQLFADSWSDFMHTLSVRELPRLDYYHQGFIYRIPPAGAIVENNMVKANTMLPGFTIRYTTDGTEPVISSTIYHKPIAEKGLIKLKVFDGKGKSSTVTEIEHL